MASASALRRYKNSLPATGDFVTGEGVATAQRANVNVLNDTAAFNPIGTTIAPDAHGAPWAQPVPVLLALVVVIFVYKYFEEKGEGKTDVAGIRIGFGNFFKFWAMWVIVANISHWIFGYWRIPGISTLALAA